MLQYLFVLLILFFGMIFYFKLADKYNIIDKPNQRSSHNYITIRGGGLVFWLAGVLYWLTILINDILGIAVQTRDDLFLIGLTLICGVSFWDDVSSLPSRMRIVVHFIAVTLVFFGLGLFSSLTWPLLIIAYIFFVGVLNAYNFMDGINGMTGLYSLVILIVLQYVNYQVIRFAIPGFINFAILACIVFLFFNFRKRAKCFAGDAGSMGISFWIVTLLLQLMITSHSLIWIFFLTVYGVDTICTILHRIYLKQNIFEAHRLHFYQILSNEKRISHLKVSSLYAFIQLIICCVIIYFYNHFEPWDWIIGIFIILILLFTYLLKFRYI